MRFILTCLIAVHLAAPGAAMACAPMSPGDWESSPKRVQANFSAAQFVALATVVSLKTVRAADPAFPDLKMNLERATFRVDRLFKGSLRPGAKFVIDTGWTSCARRVVDHQSRPFIPGAKSRKGDYPTRWLIYYTKTPYMPGAPMQLPPFEITASPLTRPLWMAVDDLPVLEKLRGG